MDREEAFRGFARRDQGLLTLERAFKMSGSAPNVVYKCCSKRCLHALEIQRPGWIAQQRGKLRALTQNRKANDRVRMALRVLNGSVSRGRLKRKGGVQHSFAYVQAFIEIDAVLLEKNACTASRLQFVETFPLSRDLRLRQTTCSMVLDNACSPSHIPWILDRGVRIITLYSMNGIQQNY